jgi:hypothetical protein
MLISVTRLRIRSLRYMPMFFIYSILSARQARRTPGNCGIDLLQDANNTFWTRTAWSNEKAMHHFMLGGMHRRAMPKLLDWCDEAATVHWIQESPQLPDWHEAHQRIVSEGRRSKVRHPSPSHLVFKIPPPNIPE